MKKFILILLAVAMLLCLSSCKETGKESENPDGVSIVLSDEGVTVDGEPLANNNRPDVYTANDIIFYLEGQDLTYGKGTAADEHSQAEADAHTVVHIAAPGTYILSGSLSHGQIAIDLGEDAATDPNAVVNLYLNGVDITCTVAPAVIFYNVYECVPDAGDTHEIDTPAAGAKVTIADGTENNVNGSYVARIYKSVELNKDGTEVESFETLHKYDGALYSKMSMNINGDTGVLNITAENEGIVSARRLTLNGGVINIDAGDDLDTEPDGSQAPGGVEPPEGVEGGQPPEGTEPPEGSQAPGESGAFENKELEEIPGGMSPLLPGDEFTVDPPHLDPPENELPVEPKPPLLPEGTSPGDTASV